LHSFLWLPMLVIPPAGLHAAPDTVPDLQRMSGEMERVSAQVAPKVVQISTQGLKVAGPGDEQTAGVLVARHGSGSGFFVSSDGYVFTNAHVIAGAIRIKVMVQPVNGSAQPGAMIEYPGRVIGVDADNDLALLKIAVEGAPFFDLGRDAAARQGQLVLAFGSPMGLAQSATMGLVSAVDRQLNPDDPRAYIQTDAPINPGNSGGPLVDLEGRLLGINTMILSQSGGSEGIGFAVPLDMIRHAFPALRDKGTVARPLLGIQPRSLTPDLIAGLRLKAHQGVLIEDVAPYGAGAVAGLLPGDVLISLNGEPVHNLRDLYLVEAGLSAGTPVPLAVMRQENLRLLSITPGAPRENAPLLSPDSVSEKENLVLRLGLYGATLTPALAASLGNLRESRGVLVVALAGSGLAGSGIEPGDVIHEVNSTGVESVEGLRTALDSVADGAPLVLQLERGGVLSYVTPSAAAVVEHLPTRASATVW